MAQAQAATDRGDYETAVALFREALGPASCKNNADTSKNHVAALHSGLALALMALKQIDDAVVHAKKALKLAPDNPAALCVLANHHLTQKRHKEAAELAEKGLTLQWPRSLPMLAGVRMAQNRHIEAESLLVFACTTAPTAEAFAQYALFHFQHNKLELAAKMAEEALRRKPFLAKVWHLLAETRLKLKQFSAARQAYENMLEREPRPTTMAVLAGLCRHLKDFTAARSWAEKALELEPDNCSALVTLGALEQDFQNTDAALQYYERALAINENQPVVHNNMAAMLVEKKDWAGALQAVDRALRTSPEQPTILTNRLMALIHLGRVDEAERELAALPVPLSPDDSFRIRHLLHKERGEFAKSRELVDEFLASGLSPDQFNYMLVNQALALRISTTDQQTRFPEAFNPLFALHKDNLRYQGMVASYGMIWAWMRGNLQLVRELENSTKGYISLPSTSEDKNSLVFYTYVHNLCVAAHEKRELYASDPNLPALNVLGESHSLSPCHLCFNWHGQQVRGASRFAFGVKMHHLAKTGESLQRHYLREHLRHMPDGPLLLTIGEIDCRPEEGIWPYARRTGQNPLDVLESTVSGYLRALDALLAERPWPSITIQGVPAPGYTFTENRDPGDLPGFLHMVREANRLLREGTHQRGWGFLDVYSLTANAEGAGNGRYHLDGHHLKPEVYSLLHPE